MSKHVDGQQGIRLPSPQLGRLPAIELHCDKLVISFVARRREYNRRVREVVEASWLAPSSAAEAAAPALENGHAAEQEQQPATQGKEQAGKERGDAAEAVADGPQAKRQKVDASSAAAVPQSPEAQAS